MNAPTRHPERMHIDDRARQVVPLVKEGIMQKVIATRLGVSDAQIVKYVRHARKLGLLPDKKKQATRSIIGHVPVGRLWDEANKLDDNIQRWIVANVPEGASLADFAIACIVDQYHDEHEE
jgi:DNA-binding CsgD family transcriptional regulator